MFGTIVRRSTSRPWFVIVGWLLAAAVIIAVSPKITDVTNTDQSALVPENAESARAADLARRAFPDSQGATAVIVVKRADRAPLSHADVDRLASLSRRLNTALSASVRGVHFAPEQSVSPNRAIGLLGVTFAGSSEDASVREAVGELRRDVAAALAGSGLSARMTGDAAIAADNAHALADAERIVTVTTLVLIVVLLLLIFRSPIAAALPLLTVGLVFGVSTSLAAAAASAIGAEVGQELPIMLTVVLFGIGTDYLLFLLFRYRERLRAGDSPYDAIVAAVERVGEAIFSAAFAVIAAFSALALAALGFFATLGPALAIGVFVMLLAALTLVPAVVVVLGRWVFWPARPANRAGAGRRSAFAAVGRFVARWPGIVVVGASVLVGGLAVGSLAFSPNHDPIRQLPSKTEAARAFDDLKLGFPAGALQPTDIYLTAGRALSQAEVATFVQRVAGVTGVASPLPPIVSADGETVRVPLILAAEPYAAESLDLVAGPLRHAARAAAPPDGAVLVGGQTMAFADVRAATNRDLAVIFPIAGLLFVLILAGLLRAVLAPVYLVVMVVIGFAATLGGATLLFQYALGWAGLAFTIPIILYLFVTAIGTDYNILVTARLREEIRDGRSPREAAALAIANTGPTVAAAAGILAGTFGSLLISGVPFFVEIGFAVTLGILIVAFVISLLLVPAATALLGKAAWWPGTPPTTPTSRADHDLEVMIAVEGRR